MESVFKIFQELKITSSSNVDGFNISVSPFTDGHKIGISKQLYPMFFIKCADAINIKSIDCNLEFISVQYNRTCQLINNKKQIEEGVYTIISLKTDSVDFQEYFLDVVDLVIKKLSQTPSLKELKIEVEKLMNLFSKFSQPPIKTIQGLWAELLVIEQCKDPDYLIKSWHSSATDKFDFNDGADKVEVKSTTKSRRVHNFSIEQLHPNKNSLLIIVSVFTVETGIGRSILGLVEMIDKKLKDKFLRFRINEIIAQTLGKDFEKSFEIFYDYQLAIDSIAYFDSLNIPSINSNIIPKELNNVRFDSDLTEISRLKKTVGNSKLHISLLRK